MATGTTTHRNVTDTWAGSGDPSANHAGARQLWLKSNERYGYLHWNRPFPLGATIVDATLYLYTKGSWGSSQTVDIHRLTERWGVNRLNWNNKPGTGAQLATITKTSAADGHEWAFDLTAAMQTVADGGIWAGVRLALAGATEKAFYSSQGPAEFRPYVVVTWSRAPQAPTALSPSGSRAVSISKPVLRFDFTDHLGSTALQAVQVQIDPAGAFASPAFDSGTVAATEPELDLAATAYAGLTGGQETRWRVRVQDGAGLWSPWSDPHRWRRDNKGTLTVDNPPVSGIISEWTPPIAWSLTGETQKAWQVFVTPDDDPGTRLYDTGRTKGTDNSWTLPKGIVEDDTDYRAVVRIWDSKDRESTPGDPVYTQAVRTFHFNEDPTPNPATSLTADNLLPRPWVRLEWDRATMPDKFVVKRDGKVVEIIDDPADVLESGTHYGWTDKDARPYKQHTWVVQSVVNRLTSANNPTVTTRNTQQGIWLVDRDRDIDVFMQGRDEGSMAHGEAGTTHTPLGRRQSVRITQGLRGLEGTITAMLADGAGKTVDGWENALTRIKERPHDNLTLSLGDESIRVEVYNITIAPTPTTPITKRVSFDFHQVGNLGFKARL